MFSYLRLSCRRLSCLLVAFLALSGGSATVSAAELPNCVNTCVPEACPETCVGCEATAPTACMPSCDGELVACPALPDAGLTDLFSWEAGYVSSPEALDHYARGCSLADDLSSTVCVSFCDKVCTGCTEGFLGPKCQYSNLTTCSGNGTARADGSCRCDAGRTGADCSRPVCPDGLTGNECQYSNADTCNDLGFVDYDGSCSCIGNATGADCSGCLPGTAGPGCIYTDLLNCNGQGVVDGEGICDCTAPYAGTYCDQCEPGSAGPMCIFSDLLDCGDRGTARFDGTCSCDAAFSGPRCDLCAPGYAGPGCIYSDATTCSGNGSVQEDGTCLCSGPFDGANCTACVAGYAGTGCLLSDAVTCNGHGTVDSEGNCTCAAGFVEGSRCDGCAVGFVGADCAYTDAGTCNGRGTAQFDGSCLCNENFSGADCSSCEAGFTGPDCLFSDAVTCNGHGTVDSDGNCTCAPTFQGPRCDLCADGYAGPECIYSDAATCNGLGVAQYDGSCDCSEGFSGAQCDACAFAGFSFPNCPTCVTDSDCSGNGVCAPSGSCVCDRGFTGATCGSCGFGYAAVLVAPVPDGSGDGSGAGSGDGSGAGSGDGSGAGSGEGSGGAVPAVLTCLRCPGVVACSGQDVCVAGSDGTGLGVAVCACGEGTFDYDCGLTRAYCSDHGQPTNGGGCDCDAGFGGASCEIERAVVCGEHGTIQADGSCLCEAGWGGDGCDSLCGNSEIGEGEGCDDGNGLAGDGCSARCLVERGYNCGTEVPSECILDLDEDGVADDQDNCVTEPNTDQADGNNNGSGDACDPYEPVAEADAGDGDASGEGALRDGSLEFDPEGSDAGTVTPPVSAPPTDASCSAAGRGISGWLSMVLVMAAASILRRRRGQGAVVGLALVAAMSGCAVEEQEQREGSAAIADTGSGVDQGAGEDAAVQDAADAPKDPPSTSDAGSSDSGPGLLGVSGAVRRPGDQEFKDYRFCTNNLQCPNGMGSCLKSVKLNRKNGTVESVNIQDIPGFGLVPPGQGVCSLGCTDHAELCESLRYGDETTPWSCQLAYVAPSPYQRAEGGGLPATVSEVELLDGVPYASICRPPFERSSSYSRDFCDVCTEGDACWPGSACVDTAPKSGAPAREKQGICLSPCTPGRVDDGCPMGFTCRVLDATAEPQIGRNKYDGGFCVPKMGECDACVDRDGDGVGTGSCTSQGTSSSVDCDDADKAVYFDKLNPDHAFPQSCGATLDANCNGKGDDVDQIGVTDDSGDLIYGAEHCGSCGSRCVGGAGTGAAQATNMCRKIATGGAPTYTCAAECDSPTTNADCTSAPGCETLLTDPSRLLVRDCDGDGHGDADATQTQFQCDVRRLIDFETEASASLFTNPAGNPWVLSGAEKHGGAKAFQAGAAEFGEAYFTTSYTSRVSAPHEIRFWYIVPDVTGNGLFAAYVNDTLVVAESSVLTWTEYVGSVAPGDVNVRFVYNRIVGDTGAFVDDLQLIPIENETRFANKRGELICRGVPVVAGAGGSYGDDCDDERSSVNPSQAELCDSGRDNDCNGAGDEEIASLGSGCVIANSETSVKGECKKGVLACKVGSGPAPVCQPSPATTEVCDNLDNDCDGATDEELNGEVAYRFGLTPVVLGTACPNEDTTAQGLCATGVWSCESGGVACRIAAPGSDAFGDDIDQNCDGIDGDGANAIFVRNGGATVAASPVEVAAYGFEAAGDAVSFVGTTAPWTVATSAGRNGGNALRSGVIGNSSTSATTLSVTLAAPGEIRFWVRVDTSPYYVPPATGCFGRLCATLYNDGFRAAIDGTPFFGFSDGVSGWTEVVRALPAGRSTVTFEFFKGPRPGVRPSQEAVWIDDVRVTASRPVGTRENPVGSMEAALALWAGRSVLSPVQFHVAGSSDPYPMPHGLRIGNGAPPFAIVGGYDVSFPARGGAVWFPGSGATRLVFGNPCGKNQAPCPGLEPVAGYAHVEPAIEVENPVNVILRKVSIEVPPPPMGFGSVAGVSCKVTDLNGCAGLKLDRVSIKMQGGAPGRDGAAGVSYVTPAAPSTFGYAVGGNPGALGCRGSGAGGKGGAGATNQNLRTGGMASNDAARGGGIGGIVSTELARMVGKRGFTPSDTIWAAGGGVAAGRTLPLSIFLNGAGSNGPAGGGGGGGAGWKLFGGGGGGGGGCGGGGGTPGAPGGSVFGLFSTSSFDLPTTLMSSVQMGPGGAGGTGGDGGLGQQGGTVTESPTPFEKPSLTSDDAWAAANKDVPFIPPGGAGGSGGGGGGGAGGSGGWSVGVAKPATIPMPLSLGVSVAGNAGLAGQGGSGGAGGPSIGLDIPPAPAMGAAGATGVSGNSIASCVLFSDGAAGDVACGLSSKRSLGAFCQSNSDCVSNNCASGAEGSNNDRCAPPGMNYLPAGSFAMGLYRSTLPDEAYHKVEITRPFFLGRTELSNADWTARGGGNTGATSGASYPVANVDWVSAVRYLNSRSTADGLTECYKVPSGCLTDAWSDGSSTCSGVAMVGEGLACDGYRLPTEAEWEYAARAGSTDEAYWGPGADRSYASYEWLGYASFNANPVALKQPNNWGLYDMAGNVAEWTTDLWAQSSGTAAIDPLVTLAGTERVARGGSTSTAPNAHTLAARLKLPPSARNAETGFRVARTVIPRVEAGTCPLGYRVVSNQCVPDVSVCPLPHGKGRSVASSTGRESCFAISCDVGYTAVGGACLASLGTRCSLNDECAQGYCATAAVGTANDRCAPAGMVYAPGAVIRQPNGAAFQATITRPYFVSATEVTQGEWKSLASGQNPACFQTADATTCTSDNANDEAPVEQVNWWSAAGYANAKSTREGLTPCYDFAGASCDLANEWKTGGSSDCTLTKYSPLSCTGYRLPTEMEWRASVMVDLDAGYDFGIPRLLVTDDFWSNKTRTDTVTRRGVNGLGLYDVVGNVAEYVEDTDYAAPGREVVDYRGQVFGNNIGVFGGGYSNDTGYYDYSTYRWNFWVSDFGRDQRGSDVGFRLVRSLVVPPEGVFCGSGFHETPGSVGVCEPNEVACRYDIAGTVGRRRWVNGAYEDSCQSACGEGEAQLPGGTCRAVGNRLTTCTSESTNSGGVGNVERGSFVRSYIQTVAGYHSGGEGVIYNYEPILMQVFFSQLTAQDPFGGYRNGSYSDRYAVDLDVGKTYTINMDYISDGYLFLYDGDNCNMIASDDDSGGGKDAQIVFTPTKSATYYIVATSGVPDVLSTYRLRVFTPDPDSYP